MSRMKWVWTAAACAAIGLGSLTTAMAQNTGAAGGQDISTKRVTLNLENADLRYALKLLFTSAGVNYTLDQNVQGTVTVSLTDVPFRTALESVLRSTQSAMPLTYRVEDGVYTISPKVEERPTDLGVRGPEETTPPAKQNFNKIVLNFADVYDVVSAFGGSVITSRFANMGGGMGGGFGGGMGGGFGGMGGFGGGGFGGMGGFGGGGFGGLGGGGFGGLGGGGFGGLGGGGFGGFGGGNFGGGFGGGGFGGGIR